MGTLSAQVAHVLHLLGSDAGSPAVGAWTPAHLTGSALPWCQHVDLVWPTLDAGSQKTVLAHARRLLQARSADSAVYSEKSGTRLVPGNCGILLLRTVITNRHTPHDVRVAALHHYADAREPAATPVASRAVCDDVCAALAPWQDARGPVRVARGLLRLVDRCADDSRGCWLADPPPHSVRVAAVAASIVRVLAAEPKHQQQQLSVAPLVGHVFSLEPSPPDASSRLPALSSPCRGILGNALLLVCVGRNKKATSGVPECRALVRDALGHILESASAPAAFSFVATLHPPLVAALAALDRPARLAQPYLHALAGFNRWCQRQMMASVGGDHESAATSADAASADTWLVALESMWLHLLAALGPRASAVLADDRVRFRKAVSDVSSSSSRADPSSPVFSATVAVWEAFYSQLLGRSV
ncbi:hypothetical protein GGI11_006254 [Coemansia sp. RSA 2049]|nr:hypothetical protein GGI11_006254 [Coemansia sp. RSA 2049]KAJ2519894.1 hypothetical protein H4217_002397 [Coemansia sp. RSA 1939]KAJ2597632.1 hypothetical protein EV177_007697 [Coemansia sp. RSA 1804]KAJ2667112.1 hypothetical protein GGH99_006681 [Coemansia sp. RSA 1285]